MAVGKYSTWNSWWCHGMEMFSALLVLCEGNPLATVDSPHKGPLMMSFHVSLLWAWTDCLANSQIPCHSSHHYVHVSWINVFLTIEIPIPPQFIQDVIDGAALQPYDWAIHYSDPNHVTTWWMILSCLNWNWTWIGYLAQVVQQVSRLLSNKFCHQHFLSDVILIIKKETIDREQQNYKWMTQFKRHTIPLLM